MTDPKIINGRALSDKLVAEFVKTTDLMEEKTGKRPALGTILVGSDPASQTYVGYKHKLAARAGVLTKDTKLSDDATRKDVENAIIAFNEDVDVSGILLQLPLPELTRPDEYDILNLIEPWKDVDGLTCGNVAALEAGRPGLRPCTPSGIMRMLDEHNVEISGKRAVVMGRSRLVGRPIFHMLMNRNATPTIIHSRTKDPGNITREADILIAAIGRAKLVTGEMVKEGAVVIDVGINRVEDGSLAGDVDFDAVYPIAGLITPVPGGVGPMTVACLIGNTINAFKHAHSIE